jgi:c-di-GMP-binding flagellar brake protein YcgR
MFKIARNHPVQVPEESEQVIDSGRIARLLAQMSKHYSPLTIYIPGYKENYTSCIVKVDKRYVLLDELMPAGGHEKLMDKRKVHATGKLDGVDIKFSTTLVRADEQKNMLTYYLKLPKTLHYQQRRQAYRVRIPLSKQLHVLIDNKDGTMTAGELHDLSHGGAGKIIPEGQNKIKIGKQYECVIELPCGEWLYCTVEMRYTKKTKSNKKQLIGAMFMDLSTIQKRLISRCISELELEAIRKRAML